jgi:hypothetical protein
MNRYTVTLVKGKKKRTVFVMAESPEAAVFLLKNMDEYEKWLVREAKGETKQ